MFKLKVFTKCSVCRDTKKICYPILAFSCNGEYHYGYLYIKIQRFIFDGKFTESSLRLILQTETTYRKLYARVCTFITKVGYVLIHLI